MVVVAALGAASLLSTARQATKIISHESTGLLDLLELPVWGFHPGDRPDRHSQVCHRLTNSCPVPVFLAGGGADSVALVEMDHDVTPVLHASLALDHVEHLAPTVGMPVRGYPGLESHEADSDRCRPAFVKGSLLSWTCEAALGWLDVPGHVLAMADQ